MTPVLTVPVVLDERAIDALAYEASAAPAGRRAVVDARQVRSTDPHGAAGLLLLGHALAQKGRRPLLQLPRNRDGVERFTQLGFGRIAHEVFELSAGDRARMEGESEGALLEFTSIRSVDDVNAVLDTLSERAGMVLTDTLHYGDPEVDAFGAMLRDLLHGLVEYSEAPQGWVCIQAQRRLRRIGRPAVMIAVVDISGGWEGAPEGALAAHPHLARVHEHVGTSGGQIAIRGGTTRLVGGSRPKQASASLETDLAPVQGALISILLPGRRRVVNSEV